MYPVVVVCILVSIKLLVALTCPLSIDALAWKLEDLEMLSLQDHADKFSTLTQKGHVDVRFLAISK